MIKNHLWESDKYNHLILIKNFHCFRDDTGGKVYRTIYQTVGKDTEGKPLLEYTNPKKQYVDIRIDSKFGKYSHCRIFGIVKWKKFFY